MSGGIGYPCKAMDMRATTVLPFKSQPIVSGSKNAHIEFFNEAMDSFVQKKVSNGRVFQQCLSVTGTGVWIAWTH